MNGLLNRRGRIFHTNKPLSETSKYAMKTHFPSVAVIGLGLIGSSFAALYRNAYPDARLVGIDVSAEAVNAALERGWIDEGHTSAENLGEVLPTCEMVMIATPVPVASDYFRVIAECDFRGVVTDACSTKKIVSQQAQEILRYPEKYIPGHPMAGSEKSGIDGAREDLFKGAHWVLCPDGETSAEDYTNLHDALTGLGARVVSLPREKHDDAIAIVSHVPHFVASSLVELAVRHADEQETLFRLAAGGFKDSTRIAAGSPALWTGIAFDNREAIVEGLDEMQGILRGYADTLREGDKEAFTKLLDRAAQARRAIPAKWVPATEDLLEVRIPLTNRPGIIAEVTTIASKVGCNVQSIGIDHITSSSAVLDMVLTDEGDIGKLSTQLIKAGFSISFNPLSKEQ